MTRSLVSLNLVHAELLQNAGNSAGKLGSRRSEQDTKTASKTTLNEQDAETILSLLSTAEWTELRVCFY